MATKTLLEFATDDLLTQLLIKERAKYRSRNNSDKHHTLVKDCDLFELSNRKMLSRMMPPRYTWVRPSNRKKLANDANDKRKNAEKALWLTILRDRGKQAEGATYGYMVELESFFLRIRQRLTSDDLQFEHPRLLPILKDVDPLPDKTKKVTCRPLSVYTQLEDKIILALTSRYLTKYLDKYLHDNILSYRHARTINGQEHHVTDFNDGIKMIQTYREAHQESRIYASDCDIKKFYDIIPHDVVRDCFERIFSQARFSDEAKSQVMKVLNAYLSSYNFYTHAWLESKNNDQVFAKMHRRFRDTEGKNTYQLKWADEILSMPTAQKESLGVPQGGALSLLIANIVLNDVDRVITAHEDPNRLFIRFCDDMILLHTDYDECCRLMKLYAESLKSHGLYYHDFENVAECSAKHFWRIKSHLPFLWDDGDGNANRYIGFLGYEMRRDGRIRLRRSNIQRFKEKFQHLKYILYRYGKKHTAEELIEFKKQKVSSIIKGVKFYESLDMQKFQNSSQYRYLERLMDKV